MSTAHEETYKGCTVQVEYDPDPTSPRECDNLGTMVCWHSRHVLGDEQPDEDAGDCLLGLAQIAVSDRYPEALLAKNRDAVLAKHYTRLPLYLYDHSGITMSTGPFGCRWDSGQVGFIYVALDKVLKEHSLATGTWKTRVKYGDEAVSLRDYAIRVLSQEVRTYDQFLTGQVYGYVVTDDTTGEEDSCWGFYQDELPGAKDSYVLGQAREAADCFAEKREAEAVESTYWAERDVVTTP